MPSRGSQALVLKDRFNQTFELGLKTSKGLDGGSGDTGNGTSKWSWQPRATKAHQLMRTVSVKRMGGQRFC